MISDVGGFDIPVTVRGSDISPDNLKEVAERVGGFPLIIKDKIAGGHGIGVIQVDSQDRLNSVSQMVQTTKETKLFQVQQFLTHDRHARLIVLGGEVTDSIAYNKTSDDFRTNRAEKETDVEPAKFSADVEQAAIRATASHLFDFGGVDVIEGQVENEGKNYVLEVNNPAYFPQSQLCTNVPISEK